MKTSESCPDCGEILYQEDEYGNDILQCLNCGKYRKRGSITFKGP